MDDVIEADVHAVAVHLGRPAPLPAKMRQFATMKRLVAIARLRGNDAGLALLAGLWLAEGKSENEIIARCWPEHQRFSVVGKR